MNCHKIIFQQGGRTVRVIQFKPTILIWLAGLTVSIPSERVKRLLPRMFLFFSNDIEIKLLKFLI